MFIVTLTALTASQGNISVHLYPLYALRICERRKVDALDHLVIEKCRSMTNFNVELRLLSHSNAITCISNESDSLESKIFHLNHFSIATDLAMHQYRLNRQL